MTTDPMRDAFEQEVAKRGWKLDHHIRYLSSGGWSVLEYDYHTVQQSFEFFKLGAWHQAALSQMSEELAVKFENMHKNGDVWITTIAAAALARNLLAKLPAQVGVGQVALNVEKLDPIPYVAVHKNHGMSHVIQNYGNHVDVITFSGDEPDHCYRINAINGGKSE